jgi:molybdopterin molybdotransferase
MVTFEQALEALLASAKRMPSESVLLRECLNRVLAQEVRADRDMPQADLSAMDGYACRKEDMAQPMRVVETIMAGQVPRRSIGPAECSRIMTGAMLPQGADTVLMFEHSEEKEGWVRATQALKKENIRQKGEDAREGDLLLSPGLLITPSVLALLASVGCDPVTVSRRPSVVILSTGDELVEPEARPGVGQIRNSNGVQTCAQLQSLGIAGRYEGIVPDRLEDLVEHIRKAQLESDLIVMSGGVSAGDLDLVPEAFQACDYRILFDSIAVQPGRPTVFGTDGRGFCCGLPGNPLSSFVIFELLLKPFLFSLMGHAYRPGLVQAVLTKTLSRRNASRQGFYPVLLETPGQATPLDYHGSAHLLALCRANGLVSVPLGEKEIKEGTLVHVRPL